MTRFVALCGWLVARAPRAYRDRYGDEIVALATARVRDEPRWRRPVRMARELVDLTRAVVREQRREAGRPVGRRRTDLGAAARRLRRRPGASLALVGVLGLGIGASAFGFNLLSTVLLRPLPYGDPDRLVLFWSYIPRIQFGTPDQPIYGARVLELRQSMTTTRAIDAFKAATFNLEAPGGDAMRVDALLTTAGLFDTMRVRPSAGRFFAPGEDIKGAPCVAVIGYGLWQRRFGGRADVVNTAVRLNGDGCTIIGVAPRGFEFPRGGEMPASFEFPSRTELWVAAPPSGPGPSDMTVLARLKDGVTVAAAQAELNASEIERDARVPASRGWNGIRVVGLRSQVVPTAIAATVATLFGAVIALLLVAAGNAAQLAVVSGLARKQEFAVRAALGADARRLGRLVVTETALIALAAGAVGAGLAFGATRFVRAFGPARFPRLAEVVFDLRTVPFLAAATIVAAVLTAAGPVWIARRAASNADLHGRERASTDPLRRWRAALIAAQVSMAVLLAVASMLLVRSVRERLAVPIGFDPGHALAFEITLPPAEYPEILRGPRPASRPAIIGAVDALLPALRAIPGVTAAGVGKPLPMSGAQEASVVVYDEMPAPRSVADVPIAEYIVVSDQFFQAMGTRMLAGREFTALDRETTENTVVVNDTLARQFWPGRSPLGHHLKLGGSVASPAPWLTVVGVVPDMKRFKLDDPPGPAMYVTYTQGGYPTLGTLPFVVRADGRSPLELVAEVRAAVRAAGLRVPVANPTAMDTVVATASADARFAMRLMLGIGGAALALTMAGLYGTVAFAVSRRRRELGIRLALGAAPRALVRQVTAGAVAPALGGLAVGLPAAMLAARFMRSLLFGVSPTDPWTFFLAAAALMVVVAVACLAPARRAAGIDPRETLRGD